MRNARRIYRYAARRMALCCALCVYASSAAALPSDQLFRDPTFDQLAAVRVTSVSKVEQPHFTTAAAIYVITAEDIRRSGARSIPEMLRLAPGVEVARIGSHRHAISIRGFNGEFANKLLVMIDGRALYSPILAGTFWDTIDTYQPDIERIEVIRGPGGTSWGVNAVNGVINIITRDSHDTQRLAVAAGAGDEDRASGAVRFGGQLGEQTAFRVFAQGFTRDASAPLNALDPRDDWRQTRIGFRVDTRDASGDYIVDGDAYSSRQDQVIFNLLDKAKLSGGYLRGGWRRKGNDSISSVQLSYDESRRESGQGISNRQAMDLDAVHNTALGARNTAIGGFSAKYSRNETIGGPGLSYAPRDRQLFFGSAFFDVATEWQPERWRSSAGIKFEYNEFTDLETLPNVRVAYTPSATQTWWAAVSRGLRIPSITDHDATNAIGRVSFPNRDLPPERLNAFELGWRAQWFDQLATDVTVFENRYSLLRTREAEFDTTLNMPVAMRASQMRGRGHGAEANAMWQPGTRWRVQASYGYLHLDLALLSTSNDFNALREAGNSPRHQAKLALFASVFSKHELSLNARYVDELWALTVPGYTEMDAQWLWKVADNFDIRISGRNLLNATHLEFRPSTAVPRGGEIERSVHVGVQWRMNDE